MRCHQPLVLIQTVSQTSRTHVGRARFDAMRPGRIVPRMMAVDTDHLTALLPSGSRARPFEDRDREPMVAERNTWVGPMEQGSAEEWRVWENMVPDDSRLRITVEDESGRVVAMADMSAGGTSRHPDGAQSGGVSVARADRGKGIGSSLLAVIIDEAVRRKAPRFLTGVNAAHTDSLQWAEKRGFREIGRRLESYIELARFDTGRFGARVDRVRRSGIALRTIADILDGHGGESGETFVRAL